MTMFQPGMEIMVTGPFAPLYRGVYVAKGTPTMGYLVIAPRDDLGREAVLPLGWLAAKGGEVVVPMPGVSFKARGESIAARERLTDGELDLTDPKDATKAADILLRHVMGSAATKLDPETPGRMVRALDELTAGYIKPREHLVKMLKAFPKEGGEGKDGGMVAVRDMTFASLCEHHVLPFTGTVSVAYVPGPKIVGLSKIARLVRAVTRKLQVQERIGQEIGDIMAEALEPLGVMVVVKGRHACMALRGVESPGEMVTSYMLGVFRDDPAARSEALALLNV
jgi:GTP cyclohydrolase I